MNCVLYSEACIIINSIRWKANIQCSKKNYFCLHCYCRMLKSIISYLSKNRPSPLFPHNTCIQGPLYPIPLQGTLAILIYFYPGTTCILKPLSFQGRTIPIILGPLPYILILSYSGTTFPQFTCVQSLHC